MLPILKSVLRLYPPAIRVERRCGKDYKLPDHDYVVRKDDIVVIPAYAIHHDDDIYPNPEKFVPTRFSAQKKAERSPYTYMPFGIGPRNCIGNNGNFKTN